MIYPGESIPSAWLPSWDEFVYTLLKFGSKPFPHTLYTGGGKVRLCEFRVEIPHGLSELVPVGLLI